MKTTPQIPGQIPDSCTLDALLTVEQFAAWQQTPVRSVRRRLASMPGVIRETRELVRIHPRTYLESRLRKTIK